MTIGQALRDFYNLHKEELNTPLLHFLEYNYKERYVALCIRINIQPVSFGKWLLKKVSEI